MSFHVLAFGLWSAESSQVNGNGQTLKAIFATAFLFGVIGLGVAGIGALRNWWAASKSSKLQDRAKTLETTEIQLDGELAVILRFMRTYVDANDSYSKSLAQAHRNMHSLAKPDQVRALVKFLIAQNEKMQRDTADLQRNLEHSSSQIEKLRWNSRRGPGAGTARSAHLAQQPALLRRQSGQGDRRSARARHRHVPGDG